MPTGYTHRVQTGEVSTLHDFALSCARAFGALISMREDSADAVIPETLQPDTKYYDEQMACARASLSELPGLGAAECDRRAAAEFEAALASHVDGNARRSAEERRYREMLDKVERWAVPDDLTGLRDFMLNQLRESIRFDCGTSYRPEPPTRKTAEAWRAEQMAEASRALAYSQTERQKEIDRVAGRNDWLRQLRTALAEQPS